MTEGDEIPWDVRSVDVHLTDYFTPPTEVSDGDDVVNIHLLDITIQIFFLEAIPLTGTVVPISDSPIDCLLGLSVLSEVMVLFPERMFLTPDTEHRLILNCPSIARRILSLIPYIGFFSPSYTPRLVSLRRWMVSSSWDLPWGCPPSIASEWNLCLQSESWQKTLSYSLIT